MSYFRRPSLRANTFEPIQNVDDRPDSFNSNLAKAFYQRQNSMRINNDNRVPSSRNSSEDYGDQDDQLYFNDDMDRYADYSNRIHSIHRNMLYNTGSTSGNLRKAYEARMGGADGKTIKRAYEKGDVGSVLENHANFIVNKMSQDPALMEDSIESEQLRKEALRDMPQCLTIKRTVKGKLLRSVKKKPKKVGCWTMLKYRTSMAFTNLKQNLKELIYMFELWYTPLKKIEGNFGTGVASFFKFLRWLFLLNFLIAVLTMAFVVAPQIVYSDNSNSTETHSKTKFHFEDIFTGEGRFTESVMYYGFYSNTSVSLLSLSYSMPEAYFFTMASIYIACFLILGYSVAVSYRKSFIETEGGLKNVFAHKVFCGWDYNIANKDAAQLKSRAIYNELKELISASLREKKEYTFSDRFWILSKRILVNLTFLASVSAIGYAIWNLQHHGTITVAIVVNIVIIFLPIIFSIIVRYEGYKSPKSMLYMNLARTFILGFVIIGILVAYWLRNSTNDDCWETLIGQEIYRLIIFDFFFSTILCALIDIGHFLIYHYFFKHRSLEFDISRNTMQIMYNQTLFWVGLFFSPILPIVVIIKLFLAWYIKLFVALKLCRASVKSWRAAQTSTWFLVMAFLSLLLIEALFGYLLSDFPSSKNCGPFRDYKFSFEIVTDGILNLKSNSQVFKVLLYATKPGFISLVLMGISVLVYFVRAKALAHRDLVRRYRETLLWEARDKEYLLRRISKLTNGQWQYKLQGREIDPIISAPNFNISMTDETGDYSAYSGPTSSTNFVTSESANFSGSGVSLEFDEPLYPQSKKYS